jgi:hypothetical protein
MFALVLLVSGTAQAAGPIKIVKVVVNCTSDDNVGSRICAALKEKVRSSKGFELVGEEEAQKSSRSFKVILVSESVDPDHPNVQSAISVVFTMPMLGQLDGFVNMWVGVTGANKIDEQAATIMANLDKETEFLQR